MDTASQEHGIAVVQLAAAEQRQRQDGGIYRQQRWGIANLDDRVFGLFLLLMVVLSVLLALIVHPWAGVGLFAATVTGIIAIRGWRRRRLAALREAQVESHRGHRVR